VSEICSQYKKFGKIRRDKQVILYIKVVSSADIQFQVAGYANKV